jgi:hypothetical protein
VSASDGVLAMWSGAHDGTGVPLRFFEENSLIPFGFEIRIILKESRWSI